MPAADLYVVHCIDAEGPLHESLDATFARLHDILGVDVEPSADNLGRIQRRELDLGGLEDSAARIFAPELLRYNDTWDKIDEMLDEMQSVAFRQRHADSTGQGWVYSWFPVDHVGYADNPRRRDIGYHNVFDHYERRLRAPSSDRDELNWHFHAMSTYREAHVCATSFLRSPHLLEVLSRRVIERAWFPSVFRAGCHSERPDSHWFLEQWVPFDFSNQGITAAPGEEDQRDLADGRFGDWRRAPATWAPYHPDHDDYQVPGACRRTIFRCLNIGTRVRLLTQNEVDRAFARAADGQPTILAFTNHDFRDMRGDVAAVHRMVTEASRKYPAVRWIASGAGSAARTTLPAPVASDMDFALEFDRSRAGRVELRIRTSTENFGPQPYLAVQTHDRGFLTDNFDVQVPRREWSYVFDRETIRPDSLALVGVAATSPNGSTCIAVHRPDGSVIAKRRRAF